MKKVAGWIILIIFGLLIIPLTVGFLFEVIGGWTSDSIQTPLQNFLERGVGLLVYVEFLALPYVGLALIKNKVDKKAKIILDILGILFLIYLFFSIGEVLQII